MRDVTFVRWCGRFLIVAGIVAGISVAACNRSEPIRIGFLGGTSGRVADLGISGRDAVQLVVEQCNQGGGIDGRRIELISRDDRQDAEAARQAVRELIDAGVVAIIGPMTSDMAMAVTPLINEAGVLCMSPTVSSQRLSGNDDFFFRVQSTTREHANRSATYHLTTGTMHRVSAVYDITNRSYCENWLSNFTRTFTAGGGRIVATIAFKANAARSFLEIAGELLAPAPDGILIISNSMDAALLCQQIRKIDTAIAITVADWGATERLLELGGKAVDGVTVIQTFDRDNPAPRYQAFRRAYLERFQREPGFPGVYASDAIQLVLAAIRIQKRNQSLKQTILAMGPFEGLQTSYRLDKYGDVEGANASISIVRNQKFVVLE